MSTATYISAYTLCKYRDGEKCKICGLEIGDRYPAGARRKWKLPEKVEKLQVDHIDGNPWHNPPDGTNWRLLCPLCNLIEEEKMRKAVVVGGVDETSANERERERADGRMPVGKRMQARKDEKARMTREEWERQRSGGPAGRILRDQVPYRDGEPVLQASAMLHPAFDGWILRELDKRQFMTQKEAINGGAHVTGGSQITVRRYLDDLVSPQGPLEQFKEQLTQEVYIRYKARFRGEE